MQKIPSFADIVHVYDCLDLKRGGLLSNKSRSNKNCVKIFFNESGYILPILQVGQADSLHSAALPLPDAATSSPCFCRARRVVSCFGEK